MLLNRAARSLAIGRGTRQYHAIGRTQKSQCMQLSLVHQATQNGVRNRSLSTLRALSATRNASSTLVVSCITGCVAGASVAGWYGTSPIAQMEASLEKANDKTTKMDDETASFLDEVMDFLGLKPTESSSEDGDDEDGSEKKKGPTEDEHGSCEEEGGGPGKRVKVPLDPELIDSLPTLDLSMVQNPSGEFSGRLLVSHEGIVYDVTEFVNHHPGGKDLILTATGLDLGHFFDNYTVHGNTEKAANWLSSMAVGKLSESDVKLAKERTTSVVHVERRHKWLNKARRRIVFIAATLPMWMSVRTAVRFVGWFVPSLGRLLARLVPVAVPGLSVGAEPLLIENDEGEAKEGDAAPRPKVAVIGGGIAGCGTAWALRQSGFDVTLFEAREQISGNARTFDWDFSKQRPNSPKDEQIVKSCCSVTAWPPLFYKNYTCLLNELNIETVHQPLSWFLNSKVPGAVGTLWAADPTPYDGSLRNVLKRDFDIYGRVVGISNTLCNLFTCRWAPWRRNDTPSMYDSHTGIGLLNPMNIVPVSSQYLCFSFPSHLVFLTKLYVHGVQSVVLNVPYDGWIRALVAGSVHSALHGIILGG